MSKNENSMAITLDTGLMAIQLHTCKTQLDIFDYSKIKPCVLIYNEHNP